MNTPPSISVIIPNLNMGCFLGDAVASIARQALPVTEILIADAQSDDNSLPIIADLAKQYPSIRCVEAPRGHPSVVRNHALREARGELIAFLDADDIWPENKLALQVARMIRAPHADVVSGFVQYFDQLDRQHLAPAATARTETLFHVHLGAALFRKTVFDAIGLFNETLRYSEDVDLLLRIREAGLVMTILRSRTLYYRRHDNSMMAQADSAKERDFKRTLAASLMRRRAKGQQAPLAPFESLIEADGLQEAGRVS